MALQKALLTCRSDRRSVSLSVYVCEGFTHLFKLQGVLSRHVSEYLSQ